MIENLRCDRCSIVFQKGGMAYTLSAIRRDKGTDPHTHGHLCPLCAEEIMHWIEDLP